MPFFIVTQDGGDIFELDATVKVTYAKSGNPTKYAVESGVLSSDHYTLEPDTISFSGYISDVKFASRRAAGEINNQDIRDARDPNSRVTKDIAQFQQGIQDLMDSGAFFDCSFSDRLTTLKNCLFQTLNIEQDTDDTGNHSLKVDFTIQQVVVANQAKNVKSPEATPPFANTTENQKKGSGTTQSPTDNENNKIQRTTAELFSTAFGG